MKGELFLKGLFFVFLLRINKGKVDLLFGLTLKMRPLNTKWPTFCHHIQTNEVYKVRSYYICTTLSG